MIGIAFPRRGFAMLLALAALMLISTLGVGLLRSATNRTMASRHALNEAHAGLIAERIEREILHWLETSPDALEMITQPGWTLLHEHHADLQAVHVHAMDLTGRLHFSGFTSKAAAGLPSTLQAALRDHIVPHPARAAPRDAAPPSPLLEECVDISVLERGSPWRLFPRPANVNPEAVDEYAAHWMTGLGDGGLNIHSAPVPLLAAALVGHGVARGDCEQAIALRQDGQPISGSLANRIIVSRRPFEQHSGAIPLTDRCRALALLITVRGNEPERAWWIAIEHRALPRAPRRSADRRPAWHVVERRRVPA